MENLGNLGTNVDLGSGVVWGVILIVNCIKRLAEKLRRIILVHFGLITFGINFRKTRKLIIVMVFGPGGRDHDFQNQLYLILGTGH